MVHEGTLEKVLNKALYEAAEKRGPSFRDELTRAQAEIIVEGKRAYLTYEHELHEREDYVHPVAVMARAEEFLKKIAVRYGLEVV